MDKKTISEVAALWKSDKQQYVKQSTMSAYALILENHILPAFGDKSHLAEDDVQAFALRKLNDGLSQKTVKDILIVLKMIQKYGVKAGLLEFSDWSIKYPTEQKSKELEVLSISHQKKLMQYVIDNFTFRNLGIYICLSTGMRIGEVCALKWSDIDLGAETIHVNRTIERIYIIEGDERRTELVIGTPKTKNSIREIPISKELMKLIRPLKKLMNDDYFVITNEAKPTEPRTYRNYYKQLLKQLGIPSLKFHGLRHSFATRCIESQCDYKTVSVILGHASISTTLNLYVHPNMEQKKMPQIIRQANRANQQLTDEVSENLKENRHKTTGMFGWLKSKKKANAKTEAENQQALNRARQQTDRILTSFASDIQQSQERSANQLFQHMEDLVRKESLINEKITQLTSEFNAEDSQMRKFGSTHLMSHQRETLHLVMWFGFAAFVLAVLFYWLFHRDANRSHRNKMLLEQSDRRNKELLALRQNMMLTVSHDLRSPLTSIMGYADLIAKTTNDDKCKQYEEAIKQSSDRMLTLLNILLSYYRLDTGKEEVEMVPFRVKDIVNSLMTEYEPVGQSLLRE